MNGIVEIVSQLKSINSIFLESPNTYYIPEFQRKFVWGDEEINQLLEDFSEDTDNFTIDSNQLEGYLLGNIVLIEDSTSSNRKIVVDGQQRLTTLTLIAKAVHTIIKEKVEESSDEERNKWYSRLGDIQKGFIIQDDIGEIKGFRIEHASSLTFGNYYKKLIQDESISEEDILNEEDRNIDTVYNISYEFIKSLDDRQLLKFIAFFRTKVKIIVTIAPNESKAFQLFETLNDRGRSLEPMDLIKNTFLKKLTEEGTREDQIRRFSEDWSEVLENLQLSSKRKITSSTFLKHFLIAYEGVNVKTNELFDYFKKNTDTFGSKNILEFVSQMNKTSRIYRDIAKGEYDSYDNSPVIKIIMKLFKIKQFYPIFILFYNEDKEIKERILQSIMKFGASVIFSDTNTNAIERVMPELISEYWENQKEDKVKAIEILIESVNKYTREKAAQAQVTVKSKNYANRSGNVDKKAENLLKFIEFYFHDNPTVMNYPRDKKPTVEHILSKKIDLDKYDFDILGFEDSEDFRVNINRIGNLTLLYDSNNSSLGNKPFSEKIDTYRDSSFIITSIIAKPHKTHIKNGIDTRRSEVINEFENQYEPVNENWTKELIERRSEDIANLIYNILVNNKNSAMNFF